MDLACIKRVDVIAYGCQYLLSCFVAKHSEQKGYEQSAQRLHVINQLN